MKIKSVLEASRTASFIFAAAAFYGGPVNAMSISAIATSPLADDPLGSITATTIAQPPDKMPGSNQKVVNGDFTITHSIFDSGHVQPLGDGNNEFTTWQFDFSKNANFTSFNLAAPLTQAVFTLTLTKLGDITNNDGIGPYNFPSTSSPWPVEINNQSYGVTDTVTFDLLKYFTSNELLGAISLSGPDFGEMPFFYADDAIISFSQLTLVNDDAGVPEPSELILLSLGLVGVCFARCNRSKIA